MYNCLWIPTAHWWLLNNVPVERYVKKSSTNLRHNMLIQFREIFAVSTFTDWP